MESLNDNLVHNKSRRTGWMQVKDYVIFFFNWVHVYGITRISFLLSKVIRFPLSEAAYTDVRLTGH